MQQIFFTIGVVLVNAAEPQTTNKAKTPKNAAIKLYLLHFLNFATWKIQKQKKKGRVCATHTYVWGTYWNIFQSNAVNKTKGKVIEPDSKQQL